MEMKSSKHSDSRFTLRQKLLSGRDGDQNYYWKADKP